MTLDTLGKILMASGGVLLLLGLLLTLGARLGLGSLPGDIAVRRGNTSFFFPIVTCIVLSIVLTVVLNLLLRWFK